MERCRDTQGWTQKLRQGPRWRNGETETIYRERERDDETEAERESQRDGETNGDRGRGQERLANGCP